MRMSLVRKRSFWVALLGSFVLLGSALAGVAAASPASAATTVNLKLASAPKECVDVWNNDYVVGEHLNLWTCPGPSGTWNLITVEGCSDGSVQNCFQFQASKDTSLCIGEPLDQDDYLVLQSCKDGTSIWYEAAPGHIYNSDGGPVHIMAAQGASNKDLITDWDGAPPSGYWWTWSW